MKARRLLALEPAEGYTVQTSVDGDAFLAPTTRRGQHGYLPSNPQLRTGLILAGAGIRPGLELPFVRQIDLAPTVDPKDFAAETSRLPELPFAGGQWQRTTMVLRPVRGPGELVLPSFVSAYAIVLLLGLGIRELSMAPVFLPRVKLMLRSFSLAECEDLARRAVAQPSTGGVRKLVQDEIQARWARQLATGVEGAR